MGDAGGEYPERLARVGYAPRFMPDGAACAVTGQGNSPEPVFLLSIPKAGTYLAAGVLEALGVRSTKLHVDDGWASDFREYREGTRMWHYQFKMPVDDALALVQPGQFAVGHLPCRADIRRLLERFSRVFIVRELRHAFVSWGRFVIAEDMDSQAAEAARSLEDGPARVHWAMNLESSAWFIPTCRGMAAWWQAPDVLSIRFEDLVGERGQEAQERVIDELARHLRLPLDDAARRAARACVGADTLTWSGGSSTLASHWDERLERWFSAIGGPALNRALGYPDEID